MNIYEILDELNIKYKEINHNPIFTVQEAKTIKTKIKGIGSKNLFLTDKKGKYYILMLEENKKANIKEISKIVNTNHLSFAQEQELNQILNLKAGSVTPLGIINDKENKVTILIDKELKNKQLLIHPNINTKTISINYKDLIKFIEYEKHKYLII